MYKKTHNLLAAARQDSRRKLRNKKSPSPLSPNSSKITSSQKFNQPKGLGYK